MDGKMSAIKVENLSKVYKLYHKPVDRMKESLHPLRKRYHRDFYALSGVSFAINKGDTIGIIGKNGSGKSTLLKILTGVLTPTSGKVEVNGRVSALLELGAGFNPEFTGLENVFFNGSIMGYSRHEMDAKIDDILAFADIGDFIHQPVKMYSSGMFARLAFAVAINVDPDILIVDEALSVGDAAFQSKCFQKFQEFREKGKTILFVTHSVDLIIKYCSHAILLDKGKMLKYDKSKDTVEMFRKLIVNSGSDTAEFDENAASRSEMQTNPSPIIYGTNDAEIVGFAVKNEQGKMSNLIYHNEKYTIQMSVKFKTDIIDPIFAYTIKSVDGLELTGINTMILKKNIGLISKGEITHVSFTQKMILNTGQYLLSLGCTKYQNDGLVVFHRIYDAVEINVVSTEQATGIAFSNSEIEIIRGQNA